MLMKLARSVYMPVRWLSRDEAQYWIERSKNKKNMYPEVQSFSKLHHFDEFGPQLSADVYNKKRNLKQTNTIIPPIVKKKSSEPVAFHSCNKLVHDSNNLYEVGYENDLNQPDFNYDFGIPFTESESPFFDNEYSDTFERAEVAHRRNNIRQFEDEEDDDMNEPIAYPTLRKTIDEHENEAVKMPAQHPIIRSHDMKEDTHVAVNFTIDENTTASGGKIVTEDVETHAMSNARVPLINPEREVLSLGKIVSYEILKHSYQRDYSIPSVSKILAATMSEKSKEALANWEKEKIALLGLEGFKKLKADTFARGHTLHSLLETFMETRQLPKARDIPDSVSKRHLVSISQAVKQFHTPLLLESAVTHPDLNYGGIVDCVALLGDTVMLVDWKTSEKVKNKASDLYDNPLQLAAYMGALNRDERYSHLGNLNNGAVVVVYNSGYPAMVHMFNQEEMEMYWNMWCDRVEMFKKM